MKNKDYFIKKTAEEMEISEELVNAVIRHQGEDAAKACHIYREIEFSGFGKFIISQHRVKRMIKGMEGKLAKEQDEEKRKEHKEYIEQLYKKLI